MLSRLVSLVGALSFAIHSAAAQSSMAPSSDSLSSATLRELQTGPPSTLPARLARFWSTMEASGSPLIEPTRRGNYHLVTFVLRGDDSLASARLDANFVYVRANSVHDDPVALGQLTRLAGTDVWYLSMELRSDLRAPYRYLVARRSGAPLQRTLDPLNKRRMAPGTQWARSLLELPDAPPQPWRGAPAGGTWSEIPVKSTVLGGSRTVFVYLPPGYRANREQPYPVFIGMDAYGFREPLNPVDRILDFLVGQRLIPETVMVLTEDVGPIGDARGYDPVVSFLADEVLPEVRRRVRISTDPADITLGGMSRRGLVATYAALARPDVIGKVLSLSGSFYWRPPGATEFEWLPRLYAESRQRPIRLYLSSGLLETSVSDANSGHYLLATNRHMRDVLTAKGYDFRYEEWMGVHSEVNWEDQLASGLKWLWSKR